MDNPISHVSKKLLPLEEQTMLLTSLLFARKHLDDILSFLPEDQSERMHNAKLRFLKLEQQERITQIILELRRLLMFKEHNIRWIHKSWIDEELNKEPLYLRNILQQVFFEKSKNKSDTESGFIPQNQIVQSFIAPFLRVPQKIAIFDPVLMRLQSLNRTNQDETISTIGKFALKALSQELYKKRFKKFLLRSFNNVDLSCDYISHEENPLAIELYKKSLLKLVLKNRGATFHELAIASGLTIIALYLSSEKARWHRTIELVLARKHGLILRFMIEEYKEYPQNPKEKSILGSLLIDAMEGAFDSLT